MTTIDAYYLFASSIAALIARFTTYPLDTIKTRLQTRHDYTPLTENILRTDNSIKSLYRGIGITLLFSVPALSLYLSTYEYVKAMTLPFSALMIHAVAGCCAELMAGLFFTPMEVIKQQLQIDSLQTNSTTSLIKAILVQEGPLGLYKGYWITIVVFLPHTVVYFIAYEQLKLLFSQQNFAVYCFAAAVASALGIIVSTPLDIIKTRWQVSAQQTEYQGGPTLIAYQLWREGGLKAFFRGFMYRVAWGVPMTTINMAIFEQLIQFH